MFCGNSSPPNGAACGHVSPDDESGGGCEGGWHHSRHRSWARGSGNPGTRRRGITAANADDLQNSFPAVQSFLKSSMCRMSCCGGDARSTTAAVHAPSGKRCGSPANSFPAIHLQQLTRSWSVGPGVFGGTIRSSEALSLRSPTWQKASLRKPNFFSQTSKRSRFRSPLRSRRVRGSFRRLF